MERSAWTVPLETPRLRSLKWGWWAKDVCLSCGGSVIDAPAGASLVTNLLLQQFWGLSPGCANKWSTSCGNGSKWKGLGGKHRLWNRLFSPEFSYRECKNKGLCKRDSEQSMMDNLDHARNCFQVSGHFITLGVRLPPSQCFLSQTRQLLRKLVPALTASLISLGWTRLRPRLQTTATLGRFNKGGV